MTHGQREGEREFFKYHLKKNTSFFPPPRFRFDLIRLTISEGEQDSVREAFERAVANVPPSKEKQFWRRYIYLWINYAVYEELEAGDFERCRQVYRTCLDLIPHRRFTFAKVWLLYAQFELRRKDVKRARQALGCAIGKCPKVKKEKRVDQ